MRYFLSKNTLFIRGSFRATGTGIPDGVAAVSTLLNHSVAEGDGMRDLVKELELAAAAAGTGGDYAGFATTVPVRTLCVFQYDFMTVFITAGLPPGKSRSHTAAGITLIACSAQSMSDDALHEATGVAREAVAAALAADGGAPVPAGADAIIIACEGVPEHAGAGSPAGSRIRSTILRGVPEAIQRAKGPAQERPAFFIFSRFKGEHWVEWTPEDCPYYPCHFEGQRCDFCYCPLYPCGDETLGQWAESSNGGKVWNCARCTMIHEPVVADYLKKYPEASKEELVRVWKAGEKTVPERQS